MTTITPEIAKDSYKKSPPLISNAMENILEIGAKLAGVSSSTLKSVEFSGSKGEEKVTVTTKSGTESSFDISGKDVKRL